MNDNLIIARNHFKTAKVVATTQDEDLLNSACFHVEQGVELCFKFLATRCGKSIGKKRDIPSAVYLLTQWGYTLDEWFVTHAADLKFWAVDARYNLNVRGTYLLCLEGLRKGYELLEYCKSLDVSDRSFKFLSEEESK